MKVYVGRIKQYSDYDDQSKWVDYDLLIYLQSCKGNPISFIKSNEYQSAISLDQKNKAIDKLGRLISASNKNIKSVKKT